MNNLERQPMPVGDNGEIPESAAGSRLVSAALQDPKPLRMESSVPPPESPFKLGGRPNLGNPTFRDWLRQRLCHHHSTVGCEDSDLGRVVRCNVCGYAVWTDPPGLQERVAGWVAAHSATPESENTDG